MIFREDVQKDNSKNKLKCQIRGDIFIKKNVKMLSHLRYIRSSGVQDNNVKLCKNMKPNVVHAFCRCYGMAPVPPKPTILQHLQGSMESEEPICQGI